MEKAPVLRSAPLAHSLLSRHLSLEMLGANDLVLLNDVLFMNGGFVEIFGELKSPAAAGSNGFLSSSPQPFAILLESSNLCV